MKALYAFLSIIILTVSYALIGLVLYLLSWKVIPIFVSSVLLTMYRTKRKKSSVDPQRQKIVIEEGLRGFGLESIQEPGQKPAKLIPFRSTYSIVKDRRVG